MFYVALYCLHPVLLPIYLSGGNLLLNPYTALGVEWEKLQSHRKFVQSDGVAAILLVKWVGKVSIIFLLVFFNLFTCMQFPPQQLKIEDSEEL